MQIKAGAKWKGTSLKHEVEMINTIEESRVSKQPHRDGLEIIFRDKDIKGTD